ncbi:MAG: hypothetical protein RUDDFDWM_001782 [Candidatus Fervidibacterota bacterium]
MSRIKPLHALILIAIVAALLSPFSSQLPDGLEWVMTRTGIEGIEKTLFKAPFQDYTVPLVTDILGRVISALVGVVAVAVVSYIIARFLLRQKRSAESQ